MKPEVNGYFLTGDFDGDHRSDIAFLSKSNNFYVSLSKESSFLPFQKWFGYRKANIENLSVGDFNGDGKDDVAFYNNLDSNLYVRTSTGAKFSPSYIWLKLDNVSKDTLLSADVNADHVTDLLIKDTKGFYITLSDGYGFEEPQYLNNSNNKKHILFGKFNEDQADDLLEINQDSQATISSLANSIE